MEVTEKSAEGLERKFQVKVPASELDDKLVARLEEMKGQVQLKGFRKGKAPVSFLKKMYGKGMMSEIVQQLVSETTQKAFSERDLQPAVAPHPHFHVVNQPVQDIEGKLNLFFAQIQVPLQTDIGDRPRQRVPSRRRADRAADSLDRRHHLRRKLNRIGTDARRGPQAL